MLTSKEIDHLLALGEGTRIEFKEAQNGVHDTIFDTVISELLTIDKSAISISGKDIITVKLKFSLHCKWRI